jgi:hypothetical protein
MSAVALTVAARDRAVTGAIGGISEATNTVPQFWDAAKLDAMEARMEAMADRVATG